jgi:1L-myo-inositol 1-phosphate cytidylyltransferase
MQGLIVAAGQGLRLRSIAPSKPLAEVGGVPLIEQVIDNARAGGIDSFVVVTGYEAGRVEAFLQILAARRGLNITTVFNPDWRGANGVSVAAAAPALEARFVLMMSDHLVDPAIFHGLMNIETAGDEVVLAVDRRLGNPLVDLDDVTRVRTDETGRILAIGKHLEPYDAFDIGVFLASHALIEGVRADVAAGGVGGISEGMRRLAAKGLARVFDIGDRFWLDVDDPAAFAQAVRRRA